MSAMRELRFFNTLGRKLEPFRTLVPGEVKVYTCGPTVYGRAHIGNLRAFLFEDLLCRTLRYLGYEVEQVMNLTDVDDKTIRGAAEKGVGLREFTAPYIEAFFADLKAIEVEPAQHYPRATDHIPEMLSIIEKLLISGHAYQTEDGSVFFRIAADEDYGRLSGMDPEQMRSGERVAGDEYAKESARDFGLWKASKEGEPSWDTPWGAGRPGWHLECSAMAMKFLGESFDIHCGGVDNIFPHHENEIAQSESVTGKTFVHTWLHSEHLIVEGQKMSKSLGNFYTLGDLLEKGVDPRAFRYLVLSVHYRQKLNFTFESLEGAAAGLRRVDDMRFRLMEAKEEAESSSLAEACAELEESFAANMADDLNTSGALGALFVFVKAVNRTLAEKGLAAGDRDRVLGSLSRIDRVLGVLDPANWLEESRGEGELSDEAIQALVDERQAARKNRDFASADRLRDQLVEAGILLEDTPEGPRWRRS